MHDLCFFIFSMKIDQENQNTVYKNQKIIFPFNQNC